LKAAIAGFEDRTRMWIGGDIELSRQVKHGFHALMFRVIERRIIPFYLLRDISN
jgi:hypothetical protein